MCCSCSGDDADINLVKLRVGFLRWFPFVSALAALMAFEMIWVLGSSETAAA